MPAPQFALNARRDLVSLTILNLPELPVGLSIKPFDVGQNCLNLGQGFHSVVAPYCGVKIPVLASTVKWQVPNRPAPISRTLALTTRALVPSLRSIIRPLSHL